MFLNLEQFQQQNKMREGNFLDLYLSSNISSTEGNVKIRIGYWSYRNLITDKIKQEFFWAIAVSVLLHGCTTYIITYLGQTILTKNIVKSINLLIVTYPSLDVILNANSLVQVWTQVAESISYDDNHYTMSIPSFYNVCSTINNLLKRTSS